MKKTNQKVEPIELNFEKQLKTKKINICLTPYEYSLLDQIRQANDKSMSQLFRDALCFYSLYYSIPNDLK